ncbi:MAG: DUF4912 domain-containing protein [Elusimicrobiales bacterium]
MGSQNVSSTEYMKGQRGPAPVEGGRLPDSYGDTEAYLLPRDPLWMFLMWDITENATRNIKAAHGEDIFSAAKPVARVYDVTGIAQFDGGNARGYYDVPIVLAARSWYLNVPEAGKSYVCDVGLVTPDGKFILIVRSNAVSLPAGRVSDVTDENWMSVSGDFERLLKLSGVEYIGKGSGEVAKALAQRWEMLKAVFSRAASWGITSLPGGRREGGQRQFWLVADCELILYGATEPDAKVTVAGRSVKLNPDGTFSMRFSFPDGTLELPIHATSNDDVDHRSITITANRVTTSDEKR